MSLLKFSSAANWSMDSSHSFGTLGQQTGTDAGRIKLGFVLLADSARILTALSEVGFNLRTMAQIVTNYGIGIGKM